MDKGVEGVAGVLQKFLSTAAYDGGGGSVEEELFGDFEANAGASTCDYGYFAGEDLGVKGGGEVFWGAHSCCCCRTTNFF